MVSLESLKMGTKAQISRIDGNAHFQSRIVSVGLIPGSHVEIILILSNSPIRTCARRAHIKHTAVLI